MVRSGARPEREADVAELEVEVDERRRAGPACASATARLRRRQRLAGAALRPEHGDDARPDPPVRRRLAEPCAARSSGSRTGPARRTAASSGCPPRPPRTPFGRTRSGALTPRSPGRSGSRRFERVEEDERAIRVTRGRRPRRRRASGSRAGTPRGRGRARRCRGGSRRRPRGGGRSRPASRPVLDGEQCSDRLGHTLTSRRELMDAGLGISRLRARLRPEHEVELRVVRCVGEVGSVPRVDLEDQVPRAVDGHREHLDVRPEELR